MPRYNYKCQDCGHIKEFTASMHRVLLKGVYCPSCNEGVSTFVRIFSPSTNFILKGKRWAKDGYSEQPKKKEDKDASVCAGDTGD